MGTLPNSGEGDVIPAEANQNHPLRQPVKGLLGHELWRHPAVAKKKREPVLSPGRPHPGRRKRLGGAGPSLET